MIRLLVLYPAADEGGLARVEEAARKLRRLSGVTALETSRRLEELGEAGPVIALGFADAESMRRAMDDGEWAAVTGALPAGAPVLRAYEVREISPLTEPVASAGSTDWEVAGELEADAEPAEPISTQIDYPSARLRDEEE